MGLFTFTKNLSLVLIAKIITLILSSGTMLFLIRYLGPERFGVFNYVVSIVNLFSMFSDFGLGALLVREMSQNKVKIKEYFSNFFGLQLINLLLLWFFMAIFLFFQDNKQLVFLFTISATGLLFINLNSPFFIVLMALEKMTFLVTASFVAGIITTVMTFAGIYYSTGLPFFLFTGVVSLFSTFCISYVYCKKYVDLRIQFNISILKRFFIRGMPFFVITVSAAIYSKIDIIMLKEMTNDAAVGYYSAAFKILALLFIIPIAIRQALYPMISNYHKNQPERADYVFIKLTKYLFIFSIIVSTTIFFHADTIIFFLFSPSYSPSASALHIMTWYFIIYCNLVTISTFLLAGNHAKLLAMTTCSCIPLNIVLNFFFIKSYSFQGAAIATLLSNLVMFVIYIIIIKKRIIPQTFHEIHFVKITLFAISGICIAAFVPEFLKSLLFTICFVFMLLVFKTISSDEKKIFKLLLNKISVNINNSFGNFNSS